MLTFARGRALGRWHAFFCALVIAAGNRAGDRDEQPLPDLSYDVLESEVWRCHCEDDSSLSALESIPQVLVLHHDPSRLLVHFLSSSNHSLTEWLSARDCLHFGQFVDLFDAQGEFPVVGDDPATGTGDDFRKRRSTGKNGERGWFEKYHNLSDIYSWFEELAESYPERVHLVRSVGRSYFGRDIMAVHITSRDREVHSKPKIYLQCLLHAREWISGPVCMYAAQVLATGSNEDISQAELIGRLLKKVEFVVIPVANPDGYYLTWVEYPKYRFWRKNLSGQNGTSCMGVDLNRNFDIKWSQMGSSSDPCSVTYHGPSAESEYEVKAIVDYLKQNRPFLGAIDFHSFSQAVVYPYGYTADAPDDGGHMQSVASHVAITMATKGTTYASHQMGSLYLASGTFGDWMLSDGFLRDNHDNYGRPLRMVPLTIELRPLYDGSNYPSGFMVPAEQILPTCEEALPAILEFASIISKLDQTNHNVD